ncbi:MAG: lytic transglycosylase domain-containing protein [Clostridium sp.]|uniref:lytic transglycosylase domain-containing protein n=1 Tax=Clostridium sp. TaxID=1506 RepID=UPI003D6D0DE5
MFKKVISVLCIVILALVLINIKTIFKMFYPVKYEEQIFKYSEKYNVDPALVIAVIRAESNFDEKATSHRGAYGLMQIMPDTATWIAESMKLKDFNVEELHDKEINVDMGCWYINNLNTEFNGNIDLVLAAYNGGRGNVQKWLKNAEYSSDGKTLNTIPYEETDKYVKKVKTNYNVYVKIYGEKLNNLQVK